MMVGGLGFFLGARSSPLGGRGLAVVQEMLANNWWTGHWSLHRGPWSRYDSQFRLKSR